MPKESFKLFKISLFSKPLTHGVAARSMDELTKKGCVALKINLSALEHISLKDGSIIQDEDFLMNLPQQTQLVFHTADEMSVNIAQEIKRHLESLRMNPKVAEELLRLAEEVVNTSDRNALFLLAQQAAGNLHAETRENDPEWFKRVADRRIATKSAVMETSAMNRIRSYFYEAKSHLRDCGLSHSQRDNASRLLADWQAKLRKQLMYRYLFSRKKRQKYTFCDQDGWFGCEGVYNLPKCEENHAINPYLSGEQRAIFSQWNLDHGIEKARTVLPKVCELLKKNAERVNWDYFYDLLFTRSNLRLVHIACHDKQEHNGLSLDEKNIFL